MDLQEPYIKKQVLIVEDESVVALDIRRRLETLNYNVAGCATSGKKALEIIQKNPPDVILMDIKLKGDLDGLETSRIIRDRWDIPVIYVTAYADVETIQQAKINNSFGYVLKPFQDREISVAVEMALYKHRMQKELNEARIRAEAADRMKSDFLANISHELRTPLNSIIGMADLSIDMCENNLQQDYLVILRKSAGMLLDIINNILSFIKYNSDEIAVENVRYDFSGFIRKVIDSVFGKAIDKGLDFNVWEERTVEGSIIGDAQKLWQILFVILDNAIKFTPSGQVDLEIRVEESNPATVDLNFTIADTGIGIPQKDIGRIFEPFTQGDGSRTRRYSGTGIGLALAKTLLERLRGSIQLESESGSGTTFRISVPQGASDSPVKNPVPVVPAGTQSVIISPSHRQRDILTQYLSDSGCLVEDYRDFTDILENLASLSKNNWVCLIHTDQINDGSFKKFLNADNDQMKKITKSARFLIMTKNGEGDLQELIKQDVVFERLKLPILRKDLNSALLRVMSRSIEEEKQPYKFSITHTNNPLRILLVEDNAINRLVNSKMLLRIGHSVSVAEDGIRAIDILKKEEFDLILMDIQMPVMDGYETTRIIRSGTEKEIPKDIPIVALTAHALEEEENKCRIVGMDGFLTKPFTPEYLEKTLIESYNQKTAGKDSVESTKENHSVFFDIIKKTKTQIDNKDWDTVIESVKELKDYSEGLPDYDGSLHEYCFRLQLLIRKKDIAAALELLDTIEETAGKLFVENN